MASIVISNSNAFDVQIPSIGRSGSVFTVPASDSLTISADPIVWYSTSEIVDFYTEHANTINGITVTASETGETLMVSVYDETGSVDSNATITTTTPGGSTYSAYNASTRYSIGDVIGVKVVSGSTTATLSVTISAGINNVVVCMAQ